MKRILPVIFAAIAALLAFAPASCSRSGPPAPSATTVVLPAAEVASHFHGALTAESAFTPDAVYSQVNSAWLKTFYPTFREEIFRHGVVRWDDRFDCNHFAGYFVALAQTEFYLGAWRSGTPAQSLAIAQFWYITKTGQGHAIVAALTERGEVFIEPQTGEELHLTDDERAACLAVIF